METKTVTVNGRAMTLIRYRNKWVFPNITAYESDLGSPVALILYALVKTWNPFARKRHLKEYACVTVNLPNCKRSAGCQFIDVNNNHSGIIGWLEESGFGKSTGRKGRSGFCIYPEFNFYSGKTFQEYYALCQKWDAEENHGV